MGTGKTVVVEVLAKKLNRQLIAVDLIIERIAGKSIPDIFQSEGEIRFRELEIEAIREVARGKNQVIACGGGSVLNSINIDRLRETSVIVNLTASPKAVLRRTSRETNIRPLLNVNGPELHIKTLMKFRRPFYGRAADFSINTSKLNIDTVVNKIIDRLKNCESFNI